MGGASLFGLIVGLFSIYNGRAVRRLLVEEEKLTREMIEKLVDRIDEGLRRMDEGFRRMDERFAKMDERFIGMDERLEALLKALNAHIKTSETEHQEIIRKLTED